MGVLILIIIIIGVVVFIISHNNPINNMETQTNVTNKLNVGFFFLCLGVLITLIT